MTRAKKKNQRPCNRHGFHGEVYWGTESYNAGLFQIYLDQVMRLAVTRYRWIGLPSTCDATFLERLLVERGRATIARDGKNGPWIVARAVYDGKLNLYDRPTRWIAQSRDQVRFQVTPRNGVMIYDSPTYSCMMPAIDMQVRELVDIQRTKQMNRLWQKIPFILETPQDMELTAVNLLSSIMGGEPATIQYRGVGSAIDVKKLDMDVPYLGGELTAAEVNVWNRIYTMLGISNITYKSERMIEDEVRSMSEPAGMQALAGLTMRRRAAEWCSKRMGCEVSCVWAQDNESENYNAVHSLKEATKILAGDTHGLAEV